MEKRICLDADGVLLNYNLGWGCIHNKLFKKEMKIVNPFSYHAHEFWGFEKLSKEEQGLFYQEFDKEGWKILPAIDGAVEATNKLKELGFKIYVVTSMPKHATQDRINNLKNEGFPDFEDVIVTGRTNATNPKKEAIEKLNPLYFVDDLKKNFLDISGVQTEFVYINPLTSSSFTYNEENLKSFKNLKSFVYSLEKKIKIKP